MRVNSKRLIQAKRQVIPDRGSEIQGIKNKYISKHLNLNQRVQKKF